MTDNEVLQKLFEVLDAGFLERGIVDLTVQSSYQPTQQGAPSNNIVNLHVIDSARYGHPENSVNGQSRTNAYWLERTYQIDALAIQDPLNTNLLTAFDLVDAASDIMQSPEARSYLLQSGIGIIRVQALRMGYIIDDRDRNENAPSFDFTISYRQSRTVTIPTVERVEAGIFNV